MVRSARQYRASSCNSNSREKGGHTELSINGLPMLYEASLLTVSSRMMMMPVAVAVCALLVSLDLLRCAVGERCDLQA